MTLYQRISTYYHKSKFAHSLRRLRGFYNRYSTLQESLDGQSSIAIIGKAASIKDINRNKLNNILRSCDYKIICNSVDLENFGLDSDITIDTQITTRVDNPSVISPVLDVKVLKQYGVSNLCVNSGMNYHNGISLYRYSKFYGDLGLQLLYPSLSPPPITTDPSAYGGRGLTIVSIVLNECLATPSVKNIFLLGIDFFGTKYLDSLVPKNDSEKFRFYSFDAASSNPRETHGIPLIKYINCLVNDPTVQKEFVIHIPREVLTFIPDNLKESLLSSPKFSAF